MIDHDQRRAARRWPSGATVRRPPGARSTSAIARGSPSHFRARVINSILGRARRTLTTSSLVRLVLVVDVVVTHVHVDHAIALVGPHHRVVAAVPDLVRLRARAERKARRIDRQQDLDVGVLAQVLLPPIPLARSRRERARAGRSSPDDSGLRRAARPTSAATCC